MEAGSEDNQAPSAVAVEKAPHDGSAESETPDVAAPAEGVSVSNGSAAADSIAAATSINVLETYLQNFNQELSSTTTPAPAVPADNTQSQDQLEQVCS